MAGDATTTAARPGVAPNSPWSPSATGPSSMGGLLRRAFQSLNPDISAIVDFAGGLYDGTLVKSGDDPGDTGANLQEVEIAFSATVDPYFRADVYLTIPNLAGLEVEEAVLTTTSLPGSLQLKAGMMRTAFGRQNTQHLHVQDLTRRAVLNALFLGPDGMRAPGAELSWLMPLPVYLLVTGGAYSVGGPEAVGDVLRSFGGGTRKDFTYLGNLRTFASITDNTSLLLGASFATGKSARLVDDGSGGSRLLEPGRSFLYGADLYLKWQPPNVSETWMMLAWTTELVLRHIPDAHQLEGALYSQLAWRVDRRWVISLRGEVDGIPSGAAVPRQYAGAGSITWNLSEFARVRLFGEARYTPADQVTHLDVSPGWSSAAFLQLEASIGAHGAHAY